MRLYAGILNPKLLKYAEEQEATAAAQSGFRPHHFTLRPVPTLQHFIDKQFHSLFTFFCFLDLKSAYGHIQRPLLWNVLAKLGLHGGMLAAIKSLYDNCTFAVNLPGRTGRRPNSLAGVK